MQNLFNTEINDFEIQNFMTKVILVKDLKKINIYHLKKEEKKSIK